MAVEPFGFKPAEIPAAERGGRESRYVATVKSVNQYLEEHRDQKSVKLDLGDVAVKTAVASFRAAISRQYSGRLRLVQRGGDLYIERAS
jgi:hypothetical protein